jgi:hypothetical protein
MPQDRSSSNPILRKVENKQTEQEKNLELFQQSLGNDVADALNDFLILQVLARHAQRNVFRVDHTIHKTKPRRQKTFGLKQFK